MAETTLAVSFSECNAGLVVDEVDADLLAALRRAVPATKGNTRRLASLGPLLQGSRGPHRRRERQRDARRAASASSNCAANRVTPGYITMGGFMPAQDEHGWYDTGDLGYQMENGHIVVCGRVKDVIIMAGRNIYPTDIERAAGRVEGVRPGCAVAVRLDAGHSRETFAVAVESNACAGPGRGAPHRAPGGPRGASPRSTCGRATSSCSVRAPFRRRRRASCAGPTPSAGHLVCAT